MNRRFPRTGFLALFGSLAVLSLALVPPARAEHLPIYIFGGTDLGWSTVSPYAPPEGDRSGLDFDLKILGSAYIQNHWIVDLGGGWQYTKRSGENLNGGFSKVITKGAVIEAGVRYGNFTGWQFGPVLNAILVGDVGLGNGALTDAQATTATLAGLQAFYEWPESKYRVRAGGRWMTDLNVPQRTVNVFQASLEIGLPITGSGPSGPHYVRRPGIQVIQKDRSLKRVRMVLDARRIEFDYDKATLRPEAAARLARLGQFLAKSRDNWEQLKISGHTDERGTVAYNQVLSENRAAAVKTALVAQGIPREKIQTRGYSSLQPIDPGHNEAAWQRNRRVEFEFTGVQDLDLVVDGVNQATDAVPGDPDEATP
jgi:outer membrane protein OmpA-like peptidoglycan-associated protein